MKRLICLVGAVLLLTINAFAKIEVNTDGWLEVSNELIVPLTSGAKPTVFQTHLYYTVYNQPVTLSAYGQYFNKSNDSTMFTTVNNCTSLTALQGSWSGYEIPPTIVKSTTLSYSSPYSSTYTREVISKPNEPTIFTFKSGVTNLAFDVNGRNTFSITRGSAFGYTSTSMTGSYDDDDGWDYDYTKSTYGTPWDVPQDGAPRMSEYGMPYYSEPAAYRSYNLVPTGSTHKIKLVNCITNQQQAGVHFGLVAHLKSTNIGETRSKTYAIAPAVLSGFYNIIGPTYQVKSGYYNGFSYTNVSMPKNQTLVSSTNLLSDEEYNSLRMVSEDKTSTQAGYWTQNPIDRGKRIGNFTPWTTGNTAVSLNFQGTEVIIDGGTYKGSPAVSGNNVTHIKQDYSSRQPLKQLLLHLQTLGQNIVRRLHMFKAVAILTISVLLLKAIGYVIENILAHSAWLEYIKRKINEDTAMTSILSGTNKIQGKNKAQYLKSWASQPGQYRPDRFQKHSHSRRRIHLLLPRPP